MHATTAQLKTITSLKKRADFLTVQKESGSERRKGAPRPAPSPDLADKSLPGKRWVTEAFVFQARPNHDGPIRFGLTVTKKLDKRAVVRNRIRRRLRAVCRDVLSTQAAPGTDFVLIAREPALTKDYADLVKDLKWCLRRTDLLRTAPLAG